MREISSSGFSSDKPVYANLLTRLFEFIAKLVDQQSEMILNEFGQGHLLFIINRLMKQAELQGNIILNAFIGMPVHACGCCNLLLYPDTPRYNRAKQHFKKIV